MHKAMPLHHLLIAMLALALAPWQGALAYPTGSVRIVVPYAPGGATDVYARLVAKSLSDQLGGPFIVENRAGASTIVGAQAVARAPRDGSTLLFTTSTTFSSNPLLFKSLPYRIEDFAPVALVGTSRLTLTISATLGPRTLEEFVEYVRARPGKVAMATIGTGSTTYLAGKTFERVYGLKMIDAPYKGSPEALRALLAGEVSLYPDGIAGVLALHKAGKVRIIAVTSAKRSPDLPEVPSMAEAGFPDFIVTNWFALLAPAGTPTDSIAKLNAAAARLVASEEFRGVLGKGGVEAESGTPETLGTLMKWHSEVTRKIIGPLNLPME